MNKHDKFFPVREVERTTWRDYVFAVVIAIAFLMLISLIGD
jgi:hypothetical protein